jgi:ketosteroid isomerase-like protein
MSEHTPVDITPRQVLARYHRAMYDVRADDLADLYAVDGIHEFPLLFPGMPPRLIGREQIRDAYRAAWAAASNVVALEEIRNVVIHETADPEVIVVEQEVAGTVSTTGRRIDAFGVLVIRVRDGLLLHVRDYLDALRINHALGRLPAIIAELPSE